MRTDQLLFTYVAAVAIALANAEVRSLLNAQGFEVMSGTPEQFGDDIKGEIAKISRLAKAAGIPAE